MKIKKRYMTLIEILVSLGLATFILTALATVHWQVVALGVKAEKERNELFTQVLIQYRIADLFSLMDDKYFYFSENEPYAGLVFTYDRGNDLNKLLSGQVLARLFVYENKLMLATLPAPNQWTSEQPPIHVEQLADKVTHFRVNFVDANGLRSETWTQERKELPAIVIVAMNIDNKPHEHRIVIPEHPRKVAE